jgi:hypothetical protein
MDASDRRMITGRRLAVAVIVHCSPVPGQLSETARKELTCSMNHRESDRKSRFFFRAVNFFSPCHASQLPMNVHEL